MVRLGPAEAGGRYHDQGPSRRRWLVRALWVSFVLAAISTAAYADHSWSTYHWRRTATEVSLNVGDNVSSAWDTYLNQAISDWNPSSRIQLRVHAEIT
jgi:hypothetical protein